MGTLQVLLMAYNVRENSHQAVHIFFQIKLWRLPSSGTLPAGGISTPELTLPQQPRRVETVSFNPAADHVSEAQRARQ